jgi:hypothetical protein
MSSNNSQQPKRPTPPVNPNARHENGDRQVQNQATVESQTSSNQEQPTTVDQDVSAEQNAVVLAAKEYGSQLNNFTGQLAQSSQDNGYALASAVVAEEFMTGVLNGQADAIAKVMDTLIPAQTAKLNERIQNFTTSTSGRVVAASQKRSMPSFAELL